MIPTAEVGCLLTSAVFFYLQGISFRVIALPIDHRSDAGIFDSRSHCGIDFRDGLPQSQFAAVEVRNLLLEI